MKRKILHFVFLTSVSLFIASCSGDEATTNNDDTQPVANNVLSINALPTSEFALFRIQYQIMQDTNSSISHSIKSNNSILTTEINLDDYYEEGKTNYLVINRMGVLLPANSHVGIWLMEPDLKYYIEDDFTDYTQWYGLKIEVKKIDGVYTFTKA